MKSDNPNLEKTTLIFSQNGDSNQTEPDNAQEITIETENAGAGDYYIISTTRWAFDSVDDLVKLLKRITPRKEK